MEQFRYSMKQQIECGCTSVILDISSTKYGISFSEAFGKFDRESERSVGIDDTFRIASVTKAVTASTVICMAAADYWKLDDPVADYLPNHLVNKISCFTNLIDIRELTIRRLLNHTSGLPDYFFNTRFRKMANERSDHIWEPMELIDVIADEGTLLFQPGSAFSYGDTGYVVIGLAIENILGIPLAVAYRNYIFAPLRMDNTYLEWREETTNRNLSHHYQGDRDLTDLNLSFDWAGGGLVSTASDLTNFQRGLFENKLFDKKWLDEMTRWNVGITWSTHSSARYLKYGLGIGVNMACGEEIIGTTGVWGAFAYYWPGGDTTITGTLNRVGADRSALLDGVIMSIKKSTAP